MELQSKSFGVVLVTAPSEEEAETIARTLVEKQLAACVSITKINSVYRWEGEVCFDSEWQLIIKTDLNNFDSLATKIQEIHSYEVPEIIALPIIKGSESYLNWITENINGKY